MNQLESQLQSNIKYDPKLQQQVPKEELEKIRMENTILERQMREDLLQTEEGKAILLRAINKAYENVLRKQGVEE